MSAPLAPRRLVVLDFESTCDEPRQPRPMEIIEFPSILVELRPWRVVEEFSRFVAPVHHTQLSPFCTELTGIAQDDVCDAPPFANVFADHQRWLRGHGLDLDGPEPDFAFATCGDWDLDSMLPEQLAHAEPPVGGVPAAYRRWVNVKRPFAEWSGATGRLEIPRMLDLLGLELEGRLHRGIDDCRNIVRIVRAIVEAGHPIHVTGER